MPQLLLLDSATKDDREFYAISLARLGKRLQRDLKIDGWVPDDPELGFTIEELNEIGADEEYHCLDIDMGLVLDLIRLTHEAAALLRRMEPVTPPATKAA